MSSLPSLPILSNDPVPLRHTAPWGQGAEGLMERGWWGTHGWVPASHLHTFVDFISLTWNTLLELSLVALRSRMQQAFVKHVRRASGKRAKALGQIWGRRMGPTGGQTEASRLGLLALLTAAGRQDRSQLSLVPGAPYLEPQVSHFLPSRLTQSLPSLENVPSRYLSSVWWRLINNNNTPLCASVSSTVL